MISENSSDQLPLGPVWSSLLEELPTWRFVTLNQSTNRP